MKVNSFKHDQSLLFIVGFPRSGTTLLQSLLCTQDNISSFPETHFFSLIIHDLPTDPVVSPKTFETIRVRLLEMNRIEFSPSILHQLYILLSNEQLTFSIIFEFLLQEYALRYEISTSANLLIEKTPDHIRSLDTIHSIYPNASFIAIVRNPLHAVYSFHTNLIQWRQPYRRLALQWMISMNNAEKFKKQHPDKLLIIRFEDLIINRKNVLSEIENYINIPILEDKLSTFPFVAQKHILPHETWKKNNLSSTFEYKERDVESSMTLFQILTIQAISGRKMRKYNFDLYPISPFIQFGFNILFYPYFLFERLLIKFRFLFFKYFRKP